MQPSTNDASPVMGVRMSENRMTPSGWKARHGCSDTSTAMSTFSAGGQGEGWGGVGWLAGVWRLQVQRAVCSLVS